MGVGGLLNIIQIPAGEMSNFSYLLWCAETCEALGVDPSLAPEKMLAALTEHRLTLKILVNTHGHHDHAAGNDVILAATKAHLAAHPAAEIDADMSIDEGALLPVGKSSVRVLHTPGHTPGSITLNPPGALITGDTLFVTRCGRADLPGGDPEALFGSLKRLATFAHETRVYPGHDYGPHPTSTIGFELANNPFMQCPDLASFIRLRMG